jgi:hypothetical protein
MALLDAVLDGDVAGVAGLHHLEGDDGLAVEAGEAALLLGALADLGHVGQLHIAAAGDRDGDVAQLLDRGGRAQHAQGLLAAADPGAAAGGVDAEAGQGLVQLRRGDAERWPCGRGR